MSHTVGPWEVSGLYFVVSKHKSGLVAACRPGLENHDGEARANADRIVECVNACDGMSDPASEIAYLKSAVTRLTNMLLAQERDLENLRQYERELDEIGRMIGCDHKHDGYLRCVQDALATRQGGA